MCYASAVSTHEALTPAVAVIVQARMGSSRLPGKVLREVGAAGTSVLAHVLRRVSRAPSVTEVLVATTTLTLFLPCVATWFMVVREFGARIACAVLVFVVTLAFGVGAALSLVVRP